MDIVATSQMAQRTGLGRQRHNVTGGSSSVVLSTASSLLCWLALLSIIRLPMVTADCWLIEGEKGFVWLAICSMNQPPYEAIPSHINRLENLPQWVLSALFSLFAKYLQFSHFCQQHYCGPEAEWEQDTVGPLFFTQSLWQPHLSEPHQEWYQLCGRWSILSTIQPAGEWWQIFIYMCIHEHIHANARSYVNAHVHNGAK